MDPNTQMTVRWVLTLVGGYLVQRGVINNSDLSSLTSEILTLIGAVIPVATWLWGRWSHSPNQVIAHVNSLDGVKVVADSVPNGAAPAVTSVPTN